MERNRYLDLESSESSNKKNRKWPTLWHIIFKLLEVKYKERILKASRKKKKTCYTQGNLYKTVSRFFSRTFSGQRERHNILKMLNEVKISNKYSTQKSCTSELKERRNFPNKLKLKEFIITRPTMQEGKC